MSEQLRDILLRRDDNQPPEISAIKKFVQERFGENVSVAVRKNQIIIMAKNASLAGSLRMHIVDLQKLTKQKTKILIRIG